MITITEQTNLGGGAWRVAWTSDVPDAVFRIYQDGLLIETSTRTSRVFGVPTGESLLVEILDDPDDQPMSAYPGKLAIAWTHAPGAAQYLIYEYVAGDWVLRGAVADSGAGAYRWESRFLEDSTVHAFRVLPVSAIGNAGDPLEISALMVRHPDAPDYQLTYSPDTGTVLID